MPADRDWSAPGRFYRRLARKRLTRRTHGARDTLDAVHEIVSENGNVFRVKVSAKLTQDDYDQLIPAWEKMIAREGSMRMLFIMEKFHGWEPGAAWDDFRFAHAHAKKIERVAMIGDKTWEKWMAKLGSFFVSDEVKYFDAAQRPEAERWINDK